MLFQLQELKEDKGGTMKEGVEQAEGGAEEDEAAPIQFL